MSEIEVPIIDLAPFCDPADIQDCKAEQEAVVAAVREACERCGFLVIRNHGADQKVLDDAWKAVRDFFDEPLSVKNEVPMTGDYPYGYGGIAMEKAGNEHGDDSGENSENQGRDTSDLKESFQLCLSSENKPANALPQVLWPSKPPHFKAALTAYYREMERVGTKLLEIFARALGLAPQWFDDKADSHWCALRVLNYPEQKGFTPNPGQLRIAAHSDYGTFTILRADDAPGGLQVQRSDGSWSDVVIPPDCFCVNLGDLMQRWTNDKWRSTVHRVVNPPADTTRATRRQSMAFFHNLNREAMVETIPTCLANGEAPKYPPINAFDHLMERHSRAIGAKHVFGAVCKN